MTTEEAQRLRIQRALEAIADGLWCIRPHTSNLWWVANGGGKTYCVTRLSDDAWDCSCDDRPPLGVVCKHVIGVQIFIGQREAAKIQDCIPSTSQIPITEELTMTPSNIHEAIAAVMQRVGYVQKTKSPGLAYTYAGEAALIEALRPPMVENSVYCYVADLIEINETQFETAKGTPMNQVSLTAIVRFVHVPSQTSIDVKARGTGMDTGDKAGNKAATGAYKYALRQTFCIETGDDPDKDPSEEQARAGTSARKSAPVTTPTPATSARPTPAVKEPAETLAEPSSNGHDAELEALLNYVIPTSIQSKHAGKKLGEVSAQVIEWYATKMAVTTPDSQALKDKAAALLALQLQTA